MKAPQVDNPNLDIAGNRRAQKWSRRALVGRFIWECSGFLFSWSPRQFWTWRTTLLRLFGARIGKGVHIHPTVQIAIPWNLSIGDYAAIGDYATLYALGHIHIGPNACVSQYAHICAGTHDYLHPEFPLVKSTIRIGEGAWVCANTFVSPGTEIGNFSILGAGSVLTSQIPDWDVYAGNPARFIKKREPFTRAQ